MAFLGVLSFAILAMILAAGASWQINAAVRDDWAPIAAGLLVLLLGPYRPPAQLTVSAVFVGLSASFIALLQSPGVGQPVIVTVITAGAPPLAIALAGASFSTVRARLLSEWQAGSSDAGERFAGEQLGRIVHAVQQDREAILNQDVVPLLTLIIERNEISADDRRRAGEIAASIRSLMVAEVDRTWLEAEIERAGRLRRGADWGDVRHVWDPERLASFMSEHQRTVMRALIVGLFANEIFVPESLHIVFTRRRSRCTVTLTARIERAEPLQQAEFSTYLAIMRVIFIRLKLVTEPRALTLKFSYDQ